LFSANPPSLEAQAQYNYEYVEDGASQGDEWPRLMQKFYLLRADYAGISPAPPIYVKGLTVPAPPAATGTGWHRTGEREIKSDDKRISSVFVMFEVYYATTSAVRTDYGFNPETGTLITKETSWVAPSDIPTFEAGKDKNQKQISSLWALRTVETAADMTGYHIQTATRVSLSIPDVLVSVAIEWAINSGVGSSASVWDGVAYGSYNLSGSENGHADSSISIIPDIVPVTKSFWARNLPAVTHFYIIQSNNVTEADILTKIGGGCLAWPVFKPDSHVVSLIGGKKSVQVSASANAASSVSDAGTSYSITQGTGQSIDVQSTHATRVIQNTIHGIINFSGDATKHMPISAIADAQWTGSGGFPSSTAYKDSGNIYLDGAVSPATLPATSPAAVPTSGTYLIEYTSKPFQKWFGFMMVQAQVFDASVLA
jgi:hypothetical protein